jgi:hypothetical protein
MADFNLILHGMMVIVEESSAATELDILIPTAEGHKYRYGWPDVDPSKEPCTVPCYAPKMELPETQNAEVKIAGYTSASYRMIDRLNPMECLRIKRSSIESFNLARTKIKVPKPDAYIEFRRVELKDGHGKGNTTEAALHTPFPSRLSEVTVLRYKNVPDGAAITFLGSAVPWCAKKANLDIYAQCEDPCVHNTSGLNALFNPVSGVIFDFQLADLCTPESPVRTTPWGFGECHLKTLGEFKYGLTNPGGCGKGYVCCG